MPRAQKGAARRQAKVRWFKAAKGNRGARRTQWRRIKETVVRSGVNATRDRKLVKRDYRSLWILRINAAARQRDESLSYSRFMYGLKMANITLNRKMLSEIAIHDPQAFDKLVERAQQELEAARAKAAEAA